MKGKVTVLHVLGGLWCGGTEAFVMNMYRSVDREKVEFNFLVHEKSKAYYDDEVEKLGGKIYRIPDRTEIGILKYFINLLIVLYKIKPDIIHAHAMFNAGVVMLASKITGIKKRVCHSHCSNDQFGDSNSRKLFRLIMRQFIRYFSTNYVSCSVSAAKYLFGEKIVKKGKVAIIHNGVELNNFLCVTKFDTDTVRKELGVSVDKYVIGMVSRLVEVKNPVYIIKILEKVRKTNKNAIVVIVGEGPLKSEIEKELKFRNLSKYVILTGNRKDIPNLLSIFDVFVLPSLFEGLPIVAIEAQAVGLPCIVSEGVPNTADLGLGLVKHIPLKNETGWVNAIINNPRKLEDKKKIEVAFNQMGYDIISAQNQLLKVYGS